MNPIAAAPPGLHSIDEFRNGVASTHRLRGFRSACGFRTVTWCLLCPLCGRRDLAEVESSGRGTVAAFTVQTVPSDEFVQEAPYAYVLVELDEGGRVSGWMPSVRRTTDLAIGDRVEWVPSEKPGVVFQREGGPSPVGSPP